MAGTALRVHEAFVDTMFVDALRASGHISAMMSHSGSRILTINNPAFARPALDKRFTINGDDFSLNPALTCRAARHKL